eukprot:4312803-Prymnesium_polylepis.1
MLCSRSETLSRANPARRARCQRDAYGGQCHTHDGAEHATKDIKVVADAWQDDRVLLATRPRVSERAGDGRS